MDAVLSPSILHVLALESRPMTVVRVDYEGWLALLPILRQQLSLKMGDELEVVVTAEGILLRRHGRRAARGVAMLEPTRAMTEEPQAAHAVVEEQEPKHAATAIMTPVSEVGRGKKHSPRRDQRKKNGEPRQGPAMGDAEPLDLFGDFWRQFAESQARKPKEEAVEVAASPMPSVQAVAPAKRKPGRPRKVAAVEPEKRKPGRPRKVQAIKHEPVAEPKRPRGRPHKAAAADPTGHMDENTGSELRRKVALPVASHDQMAARGRRMR